MMKLTKEECIKHFDNFSLILFNELDTHQLSGMTDEEQDTLWRKLVDSSECFELLINEHFESSECRVESSLTRSNPPTELEKQLKRIQELELKEKQWIETERDYRDELKELKSNPPLKFEEIKDDMWIWDNKKKRYMQVYDISYSEEGFNVNGRFPLDELYLEEFDFEENRFYRREVEDENS